MKRLTLAVLAALLLAGCGHGPSQSAAGSVHPAGWATVGPRPSFGLAPVSTVEMFDSVDVSTVPRDPFAIAGYTAGRWPTFIPLRKAFPSAHTVSIAISARYHADCLDVEPGDATPGEVPGWVHADERAGYRKPCVYSDWSEWTSQIRPVLERAGIRRSQVWEWDAFYNGVPHIDPGFDGTQWTDRAYGRNLDESLVVRAFLSIAHPPVVEPKPHPKPAPNPKPNPKLAPLIHRRAELRADLNRRRCRVSPYHGRGRYHAICKRWLIEGREVNLAIRRLGGR